MDKLVHQGDEKISRWDNKQSNVQNIGGKFARQTDHRYHPDSRSIRNVQKPLAFSGLTAYAPKGGLPVSMVDSRSRRDNRYHISGTDHDI